MSKILEMRQKRAEVWDKARAFLEKNPSPTGRELLEFCFEAIPEGLSPEDDGEDLMDEDEGTATAFELEMVCQDPSA